MDDASYRQLLKQLVGITKTFPDDKELLKSVSVVGWRLGVEHNIDLGFHELSELLEQRLAGTEESSHYQEIIEKHLSQTGTAPAEEA